MPMSVAQLLSYKRDGGELTEEQISFLVEKITDDSMDDIQLGALVTVLFMAGISESEMATFTQAMKLSGKVFKWPDEWNVGDKHSTGGVGDKISIALAPALAACGLKVPMVSGRSLGYTGGTIDKLESIPDFQTSLTMDEIQTALDDVGCCIVIPSKDIVPADKRLYEARDITNTFSSLPLVVSSIVSKKAAESLGSMVLDVKCGRGTVMKTLEAAEELANALIKAAKSCDIKTTALITSMDVPIGKMIGNALEIEECLECLKGHGPADTMELIVKLGGELLSTARIAEDVKEGEKMISEVLQNGEAIEKFCRMLEIQGTMKIVAEDMCLRGHSDQYLPKSKYQTNIEAPTSGYIHHIEARTLGEANIELGGGRKCKESVVNHAVGFQLLKVVGNKVEKGAFWLKVHHDTPLSASFLAKVEGSVVIKADQPHVPSSRVIKRIA